MKPSKNSTSFLKSSLEQLPLPGHKIDVETTNSKWRAYIEGKQNGGMRLVVTKNR